MFIVGFALLMVGSIFVYGTKYVRKLFGVSDLILKGIGFVTAVIGAFMIMHGDFPKELEFIRIIKGIGVLKWK